jgi:tetratricopeptide (TPR) repeat protein
MTADPGYAPAHAAYAETIALLADDSYGGIPEAEVYGLAKPHVMQALALNPQFARAHAVLGLMETNAGNFDAAETSLDRAIRFEPTLAPAYIWLGNLYGLTGRLQKEIEAFARAYELEPLWPLAGVNYAGQLIMRGQTDEALAVIQNMVRHHPDSQQAVALEGGIHWTAGRLAEALTYLERALALDPDNSSSKGYVARSYLGILAPERARPHLTPENERLSSFISDGPDAALAAATEAFGPYPTRPQEIAELAMWEALAGNDARAIELQESFLTGTGVGTDQITGGDGFRAALLIRALRRAGRADDAAALLVAYKEQHAERQSLGFRDSDTHNAGAFIAALEGDTEGVFAAFEVAWQAGGREVFIAAIPVLDVVHGDPRWAPLVARHRAAINAEREKLGLAPVPDDGWPTLR